MAYYAMGSYSYAGRYILTGTFRYEGSNKLGKAKKSRWLPTWNISGAWSYIWWADFTSILFIPG